MHLKKLKYITNINLEWKEYITKTINIVALLQEAVKLLLQQYGLPQL